MLGGRDVRCRRVSRNTRVGVAARPGSGRASSAPGRHHPRRQGRQAGRQVDAAGVPGPGADDEMREVEHGGILAPGGNFCKRVGAGQEENLPRLVARARAAPQRVGGVGRARAGAVPGRSASIRAVVLRRPAPPSRTGGRPRRPDRRAGAAASRRGAAGPRRGRGARRPPRRPRDGRREWDRRCRRARPSRRRCRHVGVRPPTALQAPSTWLRAARRGRRRP